MAQAADNPYTGLAQELADRPDLIHALLAAHPADGVCSGCCVPGSRSPIAAPCGIRTLAEMAAGLAAR